ncbi:C-type isolectin Sp-CL4-like [Hyla sarda]|uniref:C-type isolectin Sp-CL4-like n=1 Tax=Hyla sarda TaxID=327740 RepID=UPI0024C2AFAD|nr:C-type isolectin Sp-CL4-like [Hyla sarda]
MLSLLLLLLVGATFAQESGDFAVENSDQLSKAANDEDEKLDDAYNEMESDEKDLDLSEENHRIKPKFTEKAVGDVCPNKGTCINHFFPTPRQFFVAQRICHSYGGDLSSIHNLKTNTSLKRFVWRCSTNVNFVWIGVWKRNTSSPYRNIDGSTLDYTNWAEGLCRNYGQWCAAMNIHTGRWRSVNCNTQLPYLCTYK